MTTDIRGRIFICIFALYTIYHYMQRGPIAFLFCYVTNVVDNNGGESRLVIYLIVG